MNETPKRLRAARGYAGLSGRELAKQLGVSLDTIKRMESGARALKPMEMREIARLCNLPTAFFTADFAVLEGRDA